MSLVTVSLSALQHSCGSWQNLSFSSVLHTVHPQARPSQRSPLEKVRLSDIMEIKYDNVHWPILRFPYSFGTTGYLFMIFFFQANKRKVGKGWTCVEEPEKEEGAGREQYGFIGLLTHLHPLRGSRTQFRKERLRENGQAASLLPSL